jgi:hypothetical protein
MVTGNPFADREPVCAMENRKWCGDLVLDVMRYLLIGVNCKFSDGTGISHYKRNECFMEGYFNVSA